MLKMYLKIRPKRMIMICVDGPVLFLFKRNVTVHDIVFQEAQSFECGEPLLKKGLFFGKRVAEDGSSSAAVSPLGSLEALGTGNIEVFLVS